MTPIILPHPSNAAWDHAREIVGAFRAAKASNPVIVAALANAFAESWWTADAEGDHDQSFGPWQLKWQFYGQPILAALGIDIRTEPSLAKHVAAVSFALAMPANAGCLIKLLAAKTGVDATRIWAAEFERASAGGAVERRVAIAPEIEVWLADLASL